MVFDPILRSPPFPGAPAATAAVSHARPVFACRAELTSAENERARGIAEQIAAERVGGRFWASDRTSPWKAIGGDGPNGTGSLPPGGSRPQWFEPPSAGASVPAGSVPTSLRGDD